MKQECVQCNVKNLNSLMLKKKQRKNFKKCNSNVKTIQWDVIKFYNIKKLQVMIKIVSFNLKNVQPINSVKPSVLGVKLINIKQFAHILKFLVYFVDKWCKE